MRKLIIIVAALLAPFAVWTAGCRQDGRQASFPNGPEVKNLARSPESAANDARAPMIAAVIDPEVLATPDQPTFARIRAVMDREAQLSSRYSAEPGLFVTSPNEMAALPAAPAPSYAAPAYSAPAYANPAPVYAAPEPAPVVASLPPTPNLHRREFWSQPAAPVPAPHSGWGVPADISAMAPPAPPNTNDFSPIMLPEAIPGIFMGTEEIEPEPVRGFRPISSAPAKGTIQDTSGGALALPPAINSEYFLSPSIEELNLAVREAGGIHSRDNTDRLELKRLLNNPPPHASASGRPEWKSSAKVESLLRNDDVLQALAPLQDFSQPAAPSLPELSDLAGTGGLSLPLPDVAGLAPEPELAAVPALSDLEDLSGISLPLPEMPEPVPAPAELLAKTSAETPSSLPPARIEASPAKPEREIYMTDFWTENKTKEPAFPEISDLESFSAVSAPAPLVDVAVPDIAVPIPEPPASPEPIPTELLEKSQAIALEPLQEMTIPESILDDGKNRSEKQETPSLPVVEMPGPKTAQLPLRPFLEKPHL